ncbi:hypothetical protein C8J56DRAFT_965083 [Mycena floridula]|nr:hypothetical protein C8J56DRAFT_965083 [Mycena floridula]
MSNSMAWTAALVGLCWFLSYLNDVLRRRIAIEKTCVADLPYLGESRPTEKKLKGTAVVCGGSIIGLLAARVCQDHFENVIIVEAEPWTSSEDAKKTDGWNQNYSRTRVMQYDSYQGIQVLGFKALCQLFPAFEEECRASKIGLCPADTKVAISGITLMHPYKSYKGKLPGTLNSSRANLETLVRRLVFDSSKYSGISQITGTVTGVSRSASGTQTLDKVSVRTASGNIELDAALVVDCTGPARGGLKWLQREGFGTADVYPPGTLPLEELAIQYDHKMRYNTLSFGITPEVAKLLPIPGGFENCGSIFNCIPSPVLGESRLVYCQRVDTTTIQIAAGMWGTEYPVPTNLEEVKQHARDMRLHKPIPEWFFELLDLLQTLDAPTIASNSVAAKPPYHIRYHMGVNLPSNFVALGDSVMLVNPVFGQGINKGIMGVVVLNNVLRDFDPTSFARRFFSMQADKITSVWLSTKVPDYGFPSTIPLPGETLEDGKFARWFTWRYILLCNKRDEYASSSFWHTSNFLASPMDNYRFKMILKVLWDVIKNPNGQLPNDVDV